LLHPASGLGVHRVSSPWIPLLPKKHRAPRRLPRDAGSDPSKGSPRQQPYRITAAVALLSLPLAPPTPRGVPGLVLGDDAPIRLSEPPRRLRFADARAEARGPACTFPVPGLSHLGSLLPPIPEGAGAGEQPTSRLCSTDESVAALPPLPVTERSFLPWALVPFKVLRPPLRPRCKTWEARCTLTRSGRRPAIGQDGGPSVPLSARNPSVGSPAATACAATRCGTRSPMAYPPSAFSTPQRDLAPRPGVPSCCQGDGRRAGASGVCPVAEVRIAA